MLGDEIGGRYALLNDLVRNWDFLHFGQQLCRSVHRCVTPELHHACSTLVLKPAKAY